MRNLEKMAAALLAGTTACATAGGLDVSRDVESSGQAQALVQIGAQDVGPQTDGSNVVCTTLDHVTLAAATARSRATLASAEQWGEMVYAMNAASGSLVATTPKSVRRQVMIGRAADGSVTCARAVRMGTELPFVGRAAIEALGDHPMVQALSKMDGVSHEGTQANGDEVVCVSTVPGGNVAMARKRADLQGTTELARTEAGVELNREVLKGLGFEITATSASTQAQMRGVSTVDRTRAFEFAGKSVTCVRMHKDSRIQ